MTRIIFAAIAAVVFVAAITFGRVYLTGSHGDGSDASVKIGGPFTLTDHHGNTVTDKDFRGKYMAVFFGYTYCPDVCPTNLSTIASALDMLPPEKAKQIVPIFISVDTHRDTPEVLADYVPLFHEQIVGLTGTPEQIKDVARLYKAYYAKSEIKDADNYLIDHSAITYLMGPDGNYLTIFRHGIAPEAMAKQLDQLIP